MKRLLLIIIVLALSGCAHVVSQDLRAQAEKKVDVEDLFENPEAYAGKTVILGGVIIETKAFEDGSEVEVLEKPLDQQGRPRNTDVSRGRFLVRHPERLDPAIFSAWREITVVAVVTGFETRKMGDAEYPYLTLDSKAVYIHKENAADRRIPISFGLGVFKSY
jgi:outer membrane lipoprotein